MEAPVSGARDLQGQALVTMAALEAGARPPLAPREARAGAEPAPPEEQEEPRARDREVEEEERPSGRSRVPLWPEDLMMAAPGSGEEEDPSQPCLEDRLVVSTLVPS